MGYSSRFNGSTSKIDAGSDLIGTKAVTCWGWYKLIGDYSFQYLNSNSKFNLMIAYTNRIRLQSDGTTDIQGATVLEKNRKYFYAVTREEDGTTNFYIGDLETAPTLSGTADQNSGTPVAGTSNLIIGNRSSGARTFDGNIYTSGIVEGILDLNTITQIWSSSRKRIL